MPPEPAIPDSRHFDADNCVDLVSGLLTCEERREALAHAAHCAACEALLREVAATHERGRARAAEMLATAGEPLPAESLPGIGLRQVPPTRDAEPRLPAPAGGITTRGTIGMDGAGRPASSRQRLWLAAASVLVVFGGAWFMTSRPAGTRSGQPEFVRLPLVDPTRLVVDRYGSETDTLVLRGIEAYQRHEFETARRLLAGARADRGMELMRGVFLASAQLECGQPESTLATLEAVRPDQLPEPWRSESEWTRLVALSRTGRRASADSLSYLLSQGVGPVQERTRRLRAGSRPSP